MVEGFPELFYRKVQIRPHKACSTLLQPNESKNGATLEYEIKRHKINML